ncbi:MAG: DsbA family protein [Bacteroidetes bacterium]|nr:MAG: DsbA family protein [Bacteroidota bacterium]TAE63043.1 MAG: DsbA family protein [Bacteroidota bacterium]TAF95917.1 MAG: DsbA family protein [Bacteroidota bacterium]
MKPLLIYCYDAYCGWCYGFSGVMNQLVNNYASKLQFEVLSGGMVIADKPAHVGVMANYILSAIPTVEKATGVKFGDDYTWHLKNPDQSDWFPSSEKPAIALSIIKETMPTIATFFASDLQTSLFSEGRDLTDDEAYRHLLEKYDIEPDGFYKNLKSDTYKQKAYYDFSLCKQLKVTGFPTVFVQAPDETFYVVARGYTNYDTLQKNVEAVLAKIN